MSRDFELPVDVPKKSEIVQQRIGLIITVSIIGVIVFLLFLLSINLGLVLAKGASSLPDIKILETYHPNQSTRIFDRYNNLIANIHGDEDRVVVPLSQISPNIQRAVMAIEDNRFYQHNGVDVRGTFRALLTNVRGGDVQGGSTLTQQLVKNLFLSPERSYTRKLAEALLAMRVEKHYPKNKILEMYMNQVYWGNQAYGIEKAARRYFRKPASDLSIAESALLAGLLKAPEGISPFNYPQAARRRQLEVLAKMVEYGYISEEQRKEAANETIVLNNRQPKPSKYPYYVTYVIQELVETYGEDVVRRGGLKVFTAIDPEIQEAAEKALIGKVKGFSPYTHVTNGALVAVDVPTAEIIALVGGVDFEKSQFNNATQAKRAAGSQFKPFVYLTGFRLGVITPESPISDRPVSFNTGYSVWSPKNWDGKYMGAMDVRKALFLSRNTPTVQIGMKVGMEEIIKTARLTGVEAHIDPNFSSVLGSSGISPLEMTTAFSTFARGGVRQKPSAIRRVENVEGKPLPIEKDRPVQTLDPESVAHLNSILVDVVEKGTGRSARLPGRTVAGKTGTTDKVRDIWFTGYTPDMVCTVWMGNEKYVPLNGVFSFNSAEVWHDFAKRYYEIREIPPTEFPTPEEGKVMKQGMMVLNVAPKATSSPDFEGGVPRHRPPLPSIEPGTIGPSASEQMYSTFENTYEPIFSGDQPVNSTPQPPGSIGPPVPGPVPVPPGGPAPTIGPATESPGGRNG